MQQVAFPPLAGWTNFYVIAGSSAGALTGLQFVVMTLLAGRQGPRSMREIRAFGSPTVLHFSLALLVSASMTAPWRSLQEAGFSIEAASLIGIVYGIQTVWHARKTTYRPDAEDWFWYVILPLCSYLIMGAAAIPVMWHQTWSLFVVAATTLSFLFIGIHNAWDTVTYVAVVHRPGAKDQANDAMPASSSETPQN